MKIGLSLSMCVKDIINDKVRPSDILVIVTNTAFKSPLEACEHYRLYWMSDVIEGRGYDKPGLTSAEANEVYYDFMLPFLTNLWYKIYQPRLQEEIHTGTSIKHNPGFKLPVTGYWFDV